MPIATGPWVWRSVTLGERDTLRTVEWWEPPQGYGGSDLRKVPEMSQQGGPPGLGLFWGAGDLPSEYTIVGEDWDSLATRAAKDALAKSAGNALLDGHALREALWSLLTDHADPDGFDAPPPIMPGLDRLELHAGSRLHGELFRFGRHAHTDLVISVAQRSIARYHARDPIHTRRILDKMCEDLRIPKDLESFQRLVPINLRDEITELLPHRTTWSETWPVSESISQDTTSVDQDQPWTALLRSVIVTAASGAAISGTNVDGMARCETVLSSADHEIATGHISTSTTSSRHSGPAVRYDASANTCYFASLSGGGSGNGTFRPAKLVASVPTLLGTGSTQSQTATRNCSIVGSTLGVGINGTETESISDGSISAGVRCGVVWINNAASIHRCTAATAEDVAAGGSHELILPDVLAGSFPPAVEVSQSQPVESGDALAGSFAPESELTQSQSIDPAAAVAGSLAPATDLTQGQSVDPDDALAGSFAPPIEVSQEVSHTLDPADALAGSLVDLPELTQGQLLGTTVALAGSIAPAVALQVGDGPELPVTTGLVWNLDASELSLSDTDPVATWPDSSPGGNDVSQATGSKQPLYRTNQTPSGGPTVSFDGTDDDLKTSVTPITGSTDRTIYVVYRQSAGDAGSRPAPVSLGPGGTQPGFGQYGITTEPAVRVITGFRIWTPGVTVDQFEQLTIRQEGGTVNGLAAWRDGVALTVADTGSGTSSINTAAGGAAVGLYNLLDEWFQGDVSHILTYEGAHTTEQREAVEHYLFVKWLQFDQAIITTDALAGSFAPASQPTQNQTVEATEALAGSLVDQVGLLQHQLIVSPGVLAGSLVDEPIFSPFVAAIVGLQLGSVTLLSPSATVVILSPSAKEWII